MSAVQPRKNTPHIQLACFDVDDCCAPTEERAQAAGRRLILRELLPSKGHHGVDIPQEVYTHQCAGFSFEATLRRFAREYEFELKPEELAAFIGREEQEVINEMHLAGLAPAPNLLEALHFNAETGRESMFVSSSGDPRLKATFELIGLAPFYESGKVISCHSRFNPPRPKPDPSGYRLALEISSVSAERAIAIEDSVTGVRAGAQVMCTAVYLGLKPKEVRGEAVRKTLDAGAELFIDDWGRYPDLIKLLDNGDMATARKEFGPDKVKTT